MPNMQKLLQLIVENKDNKPKQLRAEDTGDRGQIWLYDVIDPWWGVSAESISKALDGFDGKPVDLYINSPGGDVFEGRAMQTRLKAYSGEVTAHIDGIAASAATTVALGADKRVIADGAFFMVHNSWTIAFGNKSEMRKTADLLEQIDNAIGADYATATGESRDTITAWMDDETWFDAQAALDKGFANSIFTGDDDEAAKNRATWNLSAYGNVPKALTDKPPKQEYDRAHMQRYVDMLNVIG
ncbi:MAG: head maturation protease, ClpP-related [Candidatus Reddybacter sp.]